MVILVLQILICIVFVLLGIDIANRPPMTRERRWLYRWFFIFLGFLLVCLTEIQFKLVHRAPSAPAANVAGPDPGARRIASEQEKALAHEAGVVKSNFTDLREQYQKLLADLATNASLDPNVRERVIIANARLQKINGQMTDLKHWEANLKGQLKEAGLLKQIELSKDLDDAQSVKNKVLPCFDFAIKSLAEMSEKEARLKGDKSVLTYPGLPADLSSEAKAGKRASINAAEIHFQTNSDWNFKIAFVEALAPDYDADMSVTCKGGTFHLRNEGYLLETKVDLANGETFGHEAGGGNTVKMNISDALGKLMASELNVMEASPRVQ